MTTAERKFDHPPLDAPLDEIVVRPRDQASATQVHRREPAKP